MLTDIRTDIAVNLVASHTQNELVLEIILVVAYGLEQVERPLAVTYLAHVKQVQLAVIVPDIGGNRR